ncbi:MAG: type II toxin-antitoxin system RelE/ParE family toxin [Bacteroidales bacterium]|nr:type II toxin-antitoxin system RelE/ParE family toxin [Bacteroidales bacterium]
MAKRIIIKNALIDRLRILDYWYKRIGTKTYSRKIDKEIKKLIKNLRIFPEMGRKLNKTHIRFLVKDHYLIFYTVNGDEVRILHMWDS